MDAIILLIPVLLLLWLLLRGRRQQRAAAEFQASLAPGQRVMTSSGLHARVVEVSDATVVLEPADGVRTTWARAAVARVVPDAGPEPAGSDRDSTIDGTIDGTVDRPVGGPVGPSPGAADGARGELTEAPERPER